MNSGNPYLIYNSMTNVSPYLKDERENKIHSQVEDFVVVLDGVEFAENTTLGKANLTKTSITNAVNKYLASISASSSLTTLEILTDRENGIASTSNTTSITRNEEEITLYKIEANKYQSKTNSVLSDNYDNADWYIDEEGNVYLIYNNEYDIPANVKNGVSTSSYITYKGGKITGSVVSNTSNQNTSGNETPQVEAYEIKYNTDGGSYAPTQTKNKDESITIAEAPTKEGYRFRYWEDENGNHYNAGAEYTVNESIRLTAIWEEIEKEAGSISYSTQAVNKTYGDSAFTIALTKVGDGTVSYASSEQAVATVDSTGRVTIVKPGQTTITATVADTDEYTYSQKNASYTLTVSKANSGVSISENSGSMRISQTKQIIVTNPNNIDIIVASGTTSVASVTKNSNTLVTINSTTAEGTSQISITAPANDYYNATSLTYTITVADEILLTVSQAKSTINSSNISEYIGAKITDYTPAGGGTWRVFYLDTTNKYGDGANTLFIKRDYDDNLTRTKSQYQGYTTGTYPTETFDSARISQITASMAKMNPLWASRDGVLSQRNEYFSAYLCDPNKWTAYKTSDALYAVGSPSIEMYMDAYNQWGGYETGRGPQSYKFDSGAAGYNVGVNSSYPNEGYQARNSLNQGQKNIFYTTNKKWWLASPTSKNAQYVLYVEGSSAYVFYRSSATDGLCPVVSLGN